MEAEILCLDSHAVQILVDEIDHEKVYPVLMPGISASTEHIPTKKGIAIFYLRESTRPLCSELRAGLEHEGFTVSILKLNSGIG